MNVSKIFFSLKAFNMVDPNMDTCEKRVYSRSRDLTLQVLRPRLEDQQVKAVLMLSNGSYKTFYRSLDYVDQYQQSNGDLAEFTRLVCNDAIEDPTVTGSNILAGIRS